MKALSLFALVLLGFVAAAAQAQSIQPVAQADAHTALVRQFERLSLLTADAQEVVLRRQTTQSWGTEDWENASRTTYDYNGELQTVVLQELWDGDSWENSTRTHTSYNGGLTAETVYEVWNGTAWVQESRTLFSYSGGDVSQVLFQNRVDNAWVDDERMTITMSNGVLSSSLTEVWSGQSWVPSDRYTITQEGDDVVMITENWSGSAWVNADRFVYVGLTISELFDILQEWGADVDEVFGLAFLLFFPDSIIQEWDGSQWVNVSRQVTERNENGRPVTVTPESWEEGAWVGDTRYTATYDGEGRVSVISMEMFDEEWTPFFVETHTYDAAGYLARILAQFDFGIGLTNSSQTLFEWTNTSTAAEGGEVPSRISLEPVYPNPFNPQATVSYHLARPEQALIRVFDVSGRLVATLVDGVRPAGDHTVTFEADGLPSGVYLIRLETPSYSESRTVTLLR